MKNLNVTAENFSVIRESLKNNVEVNVNNKVILVDYELNAEYLNESTGKITRTPFYYISNEGVKYNSTKLKVLLGITPEKKGEESKRKNFASEWEKVAILAKFATLEELKGAKKVLDSLIIEGERRREEERKKEEEEKRAKAIELLMSQGFTKREAENLLDSKAKNKKK